MAPCLLERPCSFTGLAPCMFERPCSVTGLVILACLNGLVHLLVWLLACLNGLVHFLVWLLACLKGLVHLLVRILECLNGLVHLLVPLRLTFRWSFKIRNTPCQSFHGLLSSNRIPRVLVCPGGEFISAATVFHDRTVGCCKGQFADTSSS